MSSADSRTTSSSRLSQFGIYRSIDARTEEFLRLSRKRQMRQGCACAAVSTAITVSVVIIVLLVYEYTMNLDSNPTLKSRMAAWHGIFNNTSPFEVKYAKTKANVDPTTLKLLPLVLKALNQSRIMENTIPAPVTETKKDVIEQNFKNNLFHGTKRNQNLFTSDFKLSSAVGYKNAFNNLDNYKKLRQKNDYKRMLNYFDKMVNVNAQDMSVEESKDESSTIRTTQTSKHKHRLYGTTKPRHGGNNTTELPKNATQLKILPINHTFQSVEITNLPRSETSFNVYKHSDRKYKNKSYNKNQPISPTNEKFKTTTKSTKYCNCSKKIADLLSKLFTDIQNILPEIELYKKNCQYDYNKPQTIAVKNTMFKTSKPNRTMTNNITSSKLSGVNRNMDFTINKKQNDQDRPNSKFDVLSLGRQTIRNASWFDLESSFTNIQNNTEGYQGTTMKAAAEPTYTTTVFEGFKTEPLSISKTVWRSKDKSEKKEANNHEIYISTTAKTSPSDYIDHYLYLSYSEHPLHKDSAAFSSKDGKKHLENALKFIDNILPLNKVYSIPYPYLNQTETDRKKNTTSIIKWLSIVKNKDKEENIFHSKRNIFLSQFNSEKTIKSQEYLTEYMFKNRTQIEPKLNKELNESAEYDKNALLQRKRIYSRQPKKDYKKEYFITRGGSKSPKTLNISVSLPINATKSKLILSISSSTFNATKKNITNLQPNVSQTFFSKYAELNNLLYHTKNISNLTIYEKFNFTHSVDDLNAFADLEYDEFKFLNDELLESEHLERNEKDNFAILKSQKQHKDNSDEPAFIKSMIPVSRPMFLDIQRSVWKHDNDAIDYGFGENSFK